MNLDRIANIAGAFIGLATVTVIFTSPNTANVIRASGTAFVGSLRAAMGK